MKTSTHDVILMEIRRSVRPDRLDEQRYRQLRARLAREDPALVGDALLGYWERETGEDAYFAQEFVASLLFVLNPPASRSLRQLLLGLRNWNLSVEEYPWYLGRQFGREAVLSELDVLHEELGEGGVSDRHADTLRYWLRAKDEVIADRLRELVAHGGVRDVAPPAGEGDRVTDLLDAGDDAP